MGIDFKITGNEFDFIKQTLIDHYEKLIIEIEDDYGKIDNNFEVVAIEFKNEVPLTCISPDREITIILGLYTLTDINWTIWQLAHECVHLLSPETQGNIPPTCLEEGLATYHAKKYSFNICNNYYDYPNNPLTLKYYYASEDVRNLLQLDPEIIKKVRAIQPSISRITEQDLLSANSRLDTGFCIKLCKSFY